MTPDSCSPVSYRLRDPLSDVDGPLSPAGSVGTRPKGPDQNRRKRNGGKREVQSRRPFRDGRTDGTPEEGPSRPPGAPSDVGRDTNLGSQRRPCLGVPVRGKDRSRDTFRSDSHPVSRNETCLAAPTRRGKLRATTTHPPQARPTGVSDEWTGYPSPQRSDPTTDWNLPKELGRAKGRDICTPLIATPTTLLKNFYHLQFQCQHDVCKSNGT